MRKRTAIILCLGTAGAVTIGGLQAYAGYDRKNMYQATLDSLRLDFSDETGIVEYGSSFDPEQFVDRHNGELTITGEVDPMCVNTYKVTYSLSAEDEKYHQNVEKTYEYIIKVQDTSAPKIRLKEDTVYLEPGDSFDPSGNIETVSDIVDGDLEKGENCDAGKYTVDSEINTGEPGTYEIKITAQDRNQNRSSAVYTVVVKDKEEEPEEAPVLQEEVPQTAAVQAPEVKEETHQESSPEPAGPKPETVSEPAADPEPAETVSTPAPEKTAEPEKKPEPASTPAPTPETKKENTWTGRKLTAAAGRIKGPSGTETYYNLNMDAVVKGLEKAGIAGEYWVRSDGVKMYGDYIICACGYSVHPKYSTVETSLGTGICADTGGFASREPSLIDIAVNW